MQQTTSHLQGGWVYPSERGAASIPSGPRPAATGGSRSLIRTKLYRPRRGSDVIPRSRLLGRLNAGLSGKVTLVCAPAGFGKTTLVVQWLQTINRLVAWLSLDEHDNELALFVHGLTAALQSVLPDACPATASLLTAPHFPPLSTSLPCSAMSWLMCPTRSSWCWMTIISSVQVRCRPWSRH